MAITLSDLLSEAWVISLQNDDRLSAFYRQAVNFPFVDSIKVFNAIDGDAETIPQTWAAGSAAYGC